MSKRKGKRALQDITVSKENMNIALGPGGDATEARKMKLCLDSPITKEQTDESHATTEGSPAKASQEEAAQPEDDARSKAESDSDLVVFLRADESLRADSPVSVSANGSEVSGNEVILTSNVMEEEKKLEKIEKNEEEKEEAELQKQKELWAHMDENTKEMRYHRLKTLLAKSNLYTEYLLQRIERQKEEERKKREREIKKKNKLKEKRTEQVKEEKVEGNSPQSSSQEQDKDKLSDEKSPPSSQGRRKISLRAPLSKSQMSSPRTPGSSQKQSQPSTPKEDKEICEEDPLPVAESEKGNKRSLSGKQNTATEEKDFEDCLREYLGKDVIPLSPSVVTMTEDSEPSPRRGRKRKNDEQSTQVLTNFFKPAEKKRKTEDKVHDKDTAQKKVSSDNTKLEQKNDDDGNVLRPALLTGGELRPYQVEGVNWLRILFENGVNGILADEMGLGKTIQCIAALAQFIHFGSPGPFLVVAPLSTLPNWKNEFQRFAPKIPTLFYHGSKDERAHIRRKIYKKHQIMAGIQVQPVVLTSYEIAMRDQPYLRNCDWNYLIVDEGHRLKNRNCRLIRELKQYRNAHRLLLTGTPLQNNLSELWSLLNFLLPEIFDDLDSFETWFDVEVISDEAADEAIIREEKKKNILGMLHQILTPFMLRRVKTDVDLEIPPKKEIMVFAPLSECQEEFYTTTVDKTILKKMVEKHAPEEAPLELSSTGRPRRSVSKKTVDYKAMLEGDDEDSDVESWVQSMIVESKPSPLPKEEKKTSQWNISLKNVMMQLRKVCNHPYLLEYPLDEAGNYKVDANIVKKCGKMKVLDKMLTELKKRGHKVLIFSQMTKMLDILEDYLGMRGMTYCRLDGSTHVNDRRDAMNAFNNDPNMFIFLLSTKAGGLGINLTGGDTVIIYDSDWNPQNDLQAQDRCHRIGQTKPVMVYRLVTVNTIDQKMVERAAAKRKLEKMVIKKGKFKSGISNFSSELKPLNPEELMKLLKSRDYQGTVGGGSVISQKELDALLDRSDMIEEFERIKRGETVPSEEPVEEDMLRTSSKESCKLFQAIDYEAGESTLSKPEPGENTPASDNTVLTSVDQKSSEETS